LGALDGFVHITADAAQRLAPLMLDEFVQH
jgi:hypothetical protein